MIEASILSLIVLAIAIVFGALIIMRSVKNFIINSIVGIAILFIANAIGGLGIAYSWPVVLICALGGALGAVIIIILHFMGLSLGL